MRFIFIISLFTTFLSCDRIETNLTTYTTLEKPDCADFSSFKATQHTNIFIEDETVTEDRIVEVEKIWDQTISLFQTTFSESVLFRDNDGKEIKPEKMKLYILKTNNLCLGHNSPSSNSPVGTIIINEGVGLMECSTFQDCLYHEIIKNLISDTNGGFHEAVISEIQEAHSLMRAKDFLKTLGFDSIKNSYFDFLNLLCEKEPNSFDEGKDESEGEIKDLSGILKDHKNIFPNLSKKVLLFLKKRLHSENILDDLLKNPKSYLKNFIYFYRLLKGISIMEGSKEFDSKDNYANTISKLESFIENPQKVLEDKEILKSLHTYFQPLDFLKDKIYYFWNHKRGIDCLVFDLPSSKHYSYYEENDSSGFVFIKILPENITYEQPCCLWYLLSHEFGHHLQLSSLFYNEFDIKPRDATITDKKKYMFSELEADMFAGFFLAHPDGLSLSQERLSLCEQYVYDIGDDCSVQLKDRNAPHGSGEQRKNAFLIGIKLSKLARFKTVTTETKLSLHKYFKEYCEKWAASPEIFLTNPKRTRFIDDYLQLPYEIIITSV